MSRTTEGRIVDEEDGDEELLLPSPSEVEGCVGKHEE